MGRQLAPKLCPMVSLCGSMENRRGRFLFSGCDSFDQVWDKPLAAKLPRFSFSINPPPSTKNRRLPRSQMGAENHLDPLHPYHTDPPAFGGPQTISFPALVDKAVGDATFPLLALASSGLPAATLHRILRLPWWSETTPRFWGRSTTITAMQWG